MLSLNLMGGYFCSSALYFNDKFPWCLSGNYVIKFKWKENNEKRKESQSSARTITVVFVDKIGQRTRCTLLNCLSISCTCSEYSENWTGGFSFLLVIANSAFYFSCDVWNTASQNVLNCHQEFVSLLFGVLWCRIFAINRMDFNWLPESNRECLSAYATTWIDFISAFEYMPFTRKLNLEPA